MNISNIPARCRQTTSMLLANLLSIHMGVIFSWTMTGFYQPELAVEFLGDKGKELLPVHGSINFEFLKRLPFVCILVALPLGAYISERFGRKKALILSANPFALCFILIAIGQNFLWILGAMACGAVACALQFYVVPMYVHEISSASRSGVHSVIQTMFIGIGIYLGQMLTLLWIINVIAILNVVLLGGFLIIPTILPESPVWLTRQNRSSEAIMIRTMLQLDDQSPISEAEKLNEEEGNVQPTNPQPVEFKRMFECPGARKGFIVSVCLLVGQALLQINILAAIVVTSEGIGKAISNTPEIAIIAASVINILILIAVCIITSLLIDRIGRRPLLIVSCIGMIIALLLAGGFNPVKQVETSSTLLASVPKLLSHFIENSQEISRPSYGVDNSILTLLIGITYYIFYFLGMSVLLVIVVEIIPSKVFSYVFATSMGIFWIVTWIVAEIFTSCLSTILDYIRYFWFGQAIICTLLLIFVCWCVPETKNKPRLTSEPVHSVMRRNPRTKRRHAKIPAQ